MTKPKHRLRRGATTQQYKETLAVLDAAEKLDRSRMKVVKPSATDTVYELGEMDGERVRMNSAARMAIHDIDIADDMISSAAGTLSYLEGIEDSGKEGHIAEMYRADVYSLVIDTLHRAQEIINECMARTRVPEPTQEGGAS